MKIKVNYHYGVDTALAAVSANETGCEIIAAEYVTSRFDLKERHARRSDLPATFVDFEISFPHEYDNVNVYDERFKMLYDLRTVMVDMGIAFDLYLITCCNMNDSSHVYHILAALVSDGGFPVVDTLEMESLLRDAAIHSMAMSDIIDKSLAIECEPLDIQMPCSDFRVEHKSVFAFNPLCNDMVMPYRDIITKQLSERLFG